MTGKCFTHTRGWVIIVPGRLVLICIYQEQRLGRSRQCPFSIRKQGDFYHGSPCFCVVYTHNHLFRQETMRVGKEKVEREKRLSSGPCPFLSRCESSWCGRRIRYCRSWRDCQETSLMVWLVQRLVSVPSLVTLQKYLSSPGV